MGTNQPQRFRRDTHMAWFLYLLGIAWIAAGCFYILYTTETRDTMAGLLQKTDKTVLAVAVFIASGLIIAAAFYSRYVWVLVLIGVLGIVKAVIILKNPGDLYGRLEAWYLNAPDQTFRLIGIVALILGTAVLSWA
jgi:uncharacterized membrane protein HdeD (DUF308 family)